MTKQYFTFSKETIVADLIAETQALPEWCSDARTAKLNRIKKLTAGFEPTDRVRVTYKQGKVRTTMTAIEIINNTEKVGA